jgi:transglutaminase-like putative cysteine protease
MTRRYRVSHDTSYRYDGDVSSSFGRAHLLPRDGHRQRCQQATVTVTPTPAELREHTDWFGNRSTYFAVTTPHRSLTVLAESVVTITDPDPDPDPVTAGWEEVRDQLSSGRGSEQLLEARGYTLPSPRLPPLVAVGDYARGSFPAGRPLAEAAVDLNGRIHRDFRYVPGSTTVGSTVAELLDRREGVCQDFAHLAVAALRSMGLPARYVSGYLETTPPPGRERLVGADASHAWASVFTGTGWLDVDPTNDRLVDASYVEVAHGRDYADVPPLQGVIFSDSGESVMRVAVDLVRIADG